MWFFGKEYMVMLQNKQGLHCRKVNWNNVHCNENQGKEDEEKYTLYFPGFKQPIR